MVNNILENHMPVHCFPSAIMAANEDIFNGSPASDVLNMENWGKCIFAVLKNAGGTGTATATIESCDDVTPTTTTAVAFKYRKMTTIDTWSAWTDATSTGISIAAGADELWEFLIESDGLSSTDSFVRLQLTEVDSTAVDGAAWATMYEPRYGQAIPATVIV